MVGIVLATLLTGFWAVQTHTYVGQWRTPYSIAQHIVEHSPIKPRALMNYGVRLIMQGDLKRGRQFLLLAGAATEAPYIQSWDRRLMRRDLLKNMAALSALESQ